MIFLETFLQKILNQPSQNNININRNMLKTRDIKLFIILLTTIHSKDLINIFNKYSIPAKLRIFIHSLREYYNNNKDIPNVQTYRDYELFVEFFNCNIKIAYLELNHSRFTIFEEKIQYLKFNNILFNIPINNVIIIIFNDFDKFFTDSLYTFCPNELIVFQLNNQLIY